VDLLPKGLGKEVELRVRLINSLLSNINNIIINR